MKVFLNGCYGACNIGDDIMLKITVNDIRNILGDKTKIYVKNKGNEKCLIHGDTNIINTEKDRKFKELLDIVASDFYVWGGGTFLYEGKDNGIKSLLSILSHVVLAKASKTKVVFYGIGFGPFRTKTGSFLANVIVSLADLVTVRDEDSYNQIKSKNTNIHLTEDLVFRIDIRKSVSYKKGNRLHIAVNTIYYEEESDLENFSDIIVKFIKSQKVDPEEVHIHFVPGWESDQETDNNSNAKILEKISKKLSIRYTFYEHENIERVLEVLQYCDFIFAKRLHILLLGMLLGKPIYTIPYHSKISKLLKNVNYDDKSGRYDIATIQKKRERSKNNFKLLKDFMESIK